MKCNNNELKNNTAVERYYPIIDGTSVPPIDPNLRNLTSNDENSCDDPQSMKQKGRYMFKYEHVLWTIHVLVTILAIIDRFTTNVSPRQSFRIGRGTAGNDRMGSLKEGPWSVAVYDILARVSGRYSIVTFNFMLIVRLHVLEQYIASSWISKYVLDCSNIAKANLKAHKINGIGLCVMTLIHIWSILLPCVTHKWRAQVVPGTFEWPLSERTPPGFKDADPVNEIMSLQVDDVFRLVEMTLLLAVITPLSVRWMQRYWHLGIQVHRFVNVLYFVDIVRRHSHPHSWILNTPIFAIWILDKLYSMRWRRNNDPNFIYDRISDDYMVLYWKHDEMTPNLAKKERMAVGSNYFMKLNPSSSVEPRHPFTTFANRSNNCSHLLTSTSGDNNDEWSSGAVIRIFHNDRRPKIGSEFESRSHTERIAQAFEDLKHSGDGDTFLKPDLKICGPFQGDMTNLIPKALLKDFTAAGAMKRTLVLVGSGSAVNFMIDFMSFVLEMKESIQISRSGNQLNCILLYSSRDRDLYNWSVGAMRILLASIKSSEHGLREAVNVKLIMSCTAADNNNPMDMTRESDCSHCNDSNTDFDEDVSIVNSSPSNTFFDKEGLALHHADTESMKFLDGRMDYQAEIPDSSVVFCQGSMQIRNVIESLCREKKDVKVHFD